MRKSKVRNFQHQIKFLENLTVSEIEEEKWQVKFTLYAEIKPICENRFESIENLTFGHIMTEGFFIFKIRFVQGVTTKMRILLKIGNLR